MQHQPLLGMAVEIGPAVTGGCQCKRVVRIQQHRSLGPLRRFLHLGRTLLGRRPVLVDLEVRPQGAPRVGSRALRIGGNGLAQQLAGLSVGSG